MSTIRTLFSSTRPIDRPIEKVIDYAADDDQRLRREIDEYEVTENVEACFRKFLEHFGTSVRTSDVTEVGIWVSGFYGSGKSSFTKYLAPHSLHQDPIA
jgi:polynucleotide 5'-kinase involved in rRNA processing